MQIEHSTSVVQTATKKLRWTGAIVDLVELIYALYEAKCFNDGKIFLKDLFYIVGDVFGCEIKNYYHQFGDIKNRVRGDRTKFLDVLKKVLMNKLFRMDGGAWK
jgi:hypothetical protein